MSDETVHEGEVVGEGAQKPLSPAQPKAEAPEAPEASEAETREPEAPATDWEALAAERTADLQRLQAEYVNYKKRVDRDRMQARQAGIETVLSDLMPVLDSITLARTHQDVGEGFRMVVDELEKVAAKHGLAAFGEIGDVFDPNLHEALMEKPMEGVTEPTISQVMQQGYKLGERVIRPARVAVANP